MERNDNSCVSCGRLTQVLTPAIFDCPECGETIYRCGRCRKQGNLYECKTCGFLGP